MDFLKDLSIDKVRNLAEDAFNQAKPKTELEAKVYEVLSHKNWGSSSTLLNELARDTYDYDKFSVITQLMWEAMENQRPAAWRVVFKGLTLLEHLVKNGSERCVDDARNHGHSLRALHQFNYYEGTIDRGLGVREKSKQLVEMLSDDERVREERQKARQLREKFGGNLGGTGSGGGGGGGGRYAGYGNDSGGWSSGGGGGGYGDSGIGSSRYDEDRRGGEYAGRYDNDPSPRASEPAATFAAMPSEEAPKKSKAKKKKKRPVEEASTPAEPVVDLFSFDAPAPAPPTEAPASEEFGGFESAAPTPAPPADPFASETPSIRQFDAFGGAPQQPQQPVSQTFDAFGGGSMNGAMNGMQAVSMVGTNVMGGTAQIMGGSMNVMGAGMNATTGSSNVMGGGASMGFAGGSSHSAGKTAPQEEDDFGDFAGASAPAPPAMGSGDPMSKLISLDGLTKNTSKNVSKLDEPVIANAAAATYAQEKDQISATMNQATKGSSMSFQGIDGLHKPSGMSGGMNAMPAAMSMGSNPSVMGGRGGGADAIGMLDPSMMQQKTTHSQMQGNGMPQQGGMYPQMMMGNQQMARSGMGGMMNPNMQQQQGFGGTQGGMGMQGSMMNQQQMMMANQQQMMMNQQGMGGSMGNMMNQQGGGQWR